MAALEVAKDVGRCSVHDCGESYCCPERRPHEQRSALSLIWKNVIGGEHDTHNHVFWNRLECIYSIVPGSYSSNLESPRLAYVSNWHWIVSGLSIRRHQDDRYRKYGVRPPNSLVRSSIRCGPRRRRERHRSAERLCQRSGPRPPEQKPFDPTGY